ncbi:DNA repair photolyase [Aeromonas hydrophila]|uniref:PA0069 family radical SAM protein n=1 Tax=Aeromonas hydrophila TaxID=644 RepID=UPI000E56B761|nr:PA0069 family radical SAM protein [Aeromonas hydrophila]AXV34484.1 DNA repair photolyase [Aeromonas hydrophila]EHA1065191.1 PA0069 family radical SAM protein [Aeromonas hydrophila]MBM0436218.1 PA0069 family radical SAM protein [Aeromonas hydrophila subsp. ranae]MBW3826600.1 PA0069 family radical SAM protein [Aeromonas hydrophila]MCX4113211.1 PA0069 family radical SAM protein [Aeromonas hydrophila]
MAGRGSSHNVDHRFSGQRVDTVDDGWSQPEWEAAFAASDPRTEVTEISARSIISYNSSPDVPFSRSINPYQGCEHGCIYCYARPSHAYLELSPGLDFETRLFAKLNAAELLRREFARPAYQPQTIVLGANTDPYQPIEHHYRLTRELLTVMLAHRHPVGIITKSAMILRDLDLLTELAREGICQVMVSVTTLNETLRRQLEPRASTGTGRLKVVEKLARAGVPVGVLAAPMIPRLNEPELEQIIKGAAEAGAHCADYILLRLPHELAPLFSDWLAQHYPGQKEAILNQLRASRDGALNSPAFGSRMRGEGQFADLLAQRFRLIAKRLGLGKRHFQLRQDAFIRPGEQLRLF